MTQDSLIFHECVDEIDVDEIYDITISRRPPEPLKSRNAEGGYHECAGRACGMVVIDDEILCPYCEEEV